MYNIISAVQLPVGVIKRYHVSHSCKSIFSLLPIHYGPQNCGRESGYRRVVSSKKLTYKLHMCFYVVSRTMLLLESG